jgi:DMSO/TMAO reductase YedYZ molybdopterin-dependent catalytic subunit
MLGIAGGSLCLGLERILLPSPIFGQTSDSFSGGELLGTVPFVRESKLAMDTPLGQELDGRLYSDFSTLTPQTPVTPTERFYIRTRASELLDEQNLESVELRSRTGEPVGLTAKELSGKARHMGTHLMECAGNSREGRFGLISVAEWSGVPLAEVLERLPHGSKDARILVSGFDRYRSQSISSVPGASWIFSFDDVRSARAFLATEMNGAPLTRDHGAPVRLVVPGWYGCTCIKWVNEIRIVSDGAETTAQMREYALRTHQLTSPKLARDYQPAAIDLAALPIRVEKWRVGNRLKYRVVGILWGGTVPIKRLEIRFNPDEEYAAVDSLHYAANDPWSFWNHAWTPRSPGVYLIRLRVAEPAMRTRRLDMGFYVRAVEISEN